MRPLPDDVLRDRMRRAGEDLRMAALALGEDFYSAAVNRAYYAAFHAARAVLGSRGLVTRKHSGVRALFNQHFVSAGEVDERFGAILRRLFDMRTTADYEDLSHISQQQAAEAVAGAAEFVEMARGMLADRPDTEPTEDD